jgi:hypothetical protein
MFTKTAGEKRKKENTTRTTIERMLVKNKELNK